MRRFRTEEGGGVAVVVAVFIAFATLAIAALAVDGGGLFSTQRSLVTNTDAMALAGAGELAEEVTCDSADAQDIVDAAVEDYRQANDPDVELLEDAIVDVECSSDGYSGSVRVRALEPSGSFFSGQDDLHATGWTEAGFTRVLEHYSQSAQEEPVLSPLAFCEAPLDDWSGEGDRITFYYSPKGNVDDLDEDFLCGDELHQGTPTLPAGWGWLNDDGEFFDPDEPEQILCTSFDGQPEDNWCLGDPGNNLMQGWQDLVGETEFMFPIFDDYSGQGANQGWRIIGTGIAKLHGCSASGGNIEIGDGPFGGNCGGTPQFITLEVVGLNLPLDGFSSVEEYFESYTDPDLSITDVSSR